MSEWKLEVNVLGLDRVKALVSLLNKHKDELPEELRESLEDLSGEAHSNVTTVVNNIVIEPMVDAANLSNAIMNTPLGGK